MFKFYDCGGQGTLLYGITALCYSGSTNNFFCFVTDVLALKIAELFGNS